MSERKESMINHDYKDKIIEKRRSGAKSKALKKKKEYVSPTGSKHKVGSAKHKYWEDIEKRGKEDKKYGAGD